MFHVPDDEYDEYDEYEDAHDGPFRITSNIHTSDLFRRILEGRKVHLTDLFGTQFTDVTSEVEYPLDVFKRVSRHDRSEVSFDSPGFEFHELLVHKIIYDTCGSFMTDNLWDYDNFMGNARSFINILKENARGKTLFEFLLRQSATNAFVQQDKSQSESRENITVTVARQMNMVTSVMYQVIMVMAILQHELEFSFNWIDLTGTFSVIETDKKTVAYWYNGRTVTLPTHGVLIKLTTLKFSTVRMYNQYKEGVTIVPPISPAHTQLNSAEGWYFFFVWPVFQRLFRIPSPFETNLLRAIASRQGVSYTPGRDLRMFINLISFFHRPDKYYSYDHFFEYRPVIQYYDLHQILNARELGTICAERDCTEFLYMEDNVYSESMAGAIISSTEIDQAMLNAMVGTSKYLFVTPRLFIDYTLETGAMVSANEPTSEIADMFAIGRLTREVFFSMKNRPLKNKRGVCAAMYPMAKAETSPFVVSFVDDILNGRSAVARFFNNIECIEQVSKFIQGIASPDTIDIAYLQDAGTLPSSSPFGRRRRMPPSRFGTIQFPDVPIDSTFVNSLTAYLSTLTTPDLSGLVSQTTNAIVSTAATAASGTVGALTSAASAAVRSAAAATGGAVAFAAAGAGPLGLAATLLPDNVKTALGAAAVIYTVRNMMVSQNAADRGKVVKEERPARKDISKDPCFIARGSQGVILRMYAQDGTGVAVKQANVPIKKSRLSCPMNTTTEKGCYPDMNEIVISVLCSHLYSSGRSPHFVQIFDVFACDDLTDNWSDAVKRFVGFDVKVPSRSKDFTFPYLVMELIDGSMDKFPAFVAKLHSYFINVMHKEDKDIPSSSLLLDNALLQAFMALHTFQYELKGMHNDLHLGNLFLKICDDTLFNGKPLKEYEYFEYTLHTHGRDPIPVKIPNMGFIVKLGDMGHASVEFAVGGIGRVPHADPEYHAENAVLYRKYIQYDPNKDTPDVDFADTWSTYYWFPNIKRRLRNFVKSFMKTDVSQMGPIGRSLHEFLNALGTEKLGQLIESYDARRRRSFNPSYDIGTLINHLATRPWGFYNRFVSTYGRIERANHLKIHGDFKNYRYFMAFNTLQILTRFPTFTMPHFDFCYTTVTNILEVYIYQNPEMGVLPEEPTVLIDMVASPRLGGAGAGGASAAFGRMLRRSSVIDFETFVKKYPSKSKSKAIRKYARAMQKIRRLHLDARRSSLQLFA